MGSVVDRDDWPLIVLARATRGTLTPVQIQKSLFLLSEEGDVEGDFYTFEPYNYGPFSKQIYKDLEVLSSLGLVKIEKELSDKWSSYVLTPDGYRAGMEAYGKLRTDLIEYTDNVVSWVEKKVFLSLSEQFIRNIPNSR